MKIYRKLFRVYKKFLSLFLATSLLILGLTVLTYENSFIIYSKTIKLKELKEFNSKNIIITANIDIDVRANNPTNLLKAINKKLENTEVTIYELKKNDAARYILILEGIVAYLLGIVISIYIVKKGTRETTLKALIHKAFTSKVLPVYTVLVLAFYLLGKIELFLGCTGIFSDLLLNILIVILATLNNIIVGIFTIGVSIGPEI